MRLTIDPRFGDNLVAANERTIKDIGLQYNGLNVILDNALGDDVLAVNPRTHDKLQAEGKVDDHLSDIIADEGDNTSDEDNTTESPLMVFPEEYYYDLTKQEQKNLLKEHGLSKTEIFKLRFEKQRVDKLLELQED